MAEIDARSGTELRAHRRRRMRFEVRAVGLELIAEKGFDEVTVEEIAAKTHISQRTFFRYFPTKEDLVFDRETYFGELGDFILALPSVDKPEEDLKQAWVETFKQLESDLRNLTVLREVIVKNPSLLSRTTGQLFAGMDPIVEIVAKRMGCDPNADMRPMVVVASGLVTAMAVIRMWSLDDTESLSEIQARVSGLDDFIVRTRRGSRKSSSARSKK